MTKAPKTKRDRIVEELRSLIESGEIPRGGRIRQSELAVRFDTSTTPVREALRQLEADGLLVSSPHRGVRVASVDVEDVKGVYVARRLLEPYAMQRAVTRVSRRDLVRAAELNQRIAEPRKGGVGVEDANREFHFLFYDRCGLPGLRNEIDTLWLGFPWDILKVIGERRQASIREHEQLLRCFAEEDLDGVKVAVEDHLRKSYLALAAHLGEPSAEDPFELDVD
jgi:DNA-binding GntR family transcriptional regulator